MGTRFSAENLQFLKLKNLRLLHGQVFVVRTIWIRPLVSLILHILSSGSYLLDYLAIVYFHTCYNFLCVLSVLSHWLFRRKSLVIPETYIIFISGYPQVTSLTRSQIKDY